MKSEIVRGCARSHEMWPQVSGLQPLPCAELQRCLFRRIADLVKTGDLVKTCTGFAKTFKNMSRSCVTADR